MRRQQALVNSPVDQALCRPLLGSIRPCSCGKTLAPRQGVCRPKCHARTTVAEAGDREGAHVGPQGSWQPGTECNAPSYTAAQIAKTKNAPPRVGSHVFAQRNCLAKLTISGE